MAARKLHAWLASPILVGCLMLTLIVPTLSQTIKSVDILNAKPNRETDKTEFEVASIRPSDLHSDWRRDGLDYYDGAPHSALFSWNDFLLNYILFAYHIPFTDVQGRALYNQLNAAKMDKFKYDIEARTSAVPTKEQLRQMLRSLLEDRFNLKIRYETRKSPVYELKIDAAGKLGPHLVVDAKNASCITAGSEGTQADSKAKVPFCGGAAVITRDQNLFTHVTMAAVPMAQFVDTINTLGKGMGGLEDFPIVDETGLSEKYDIQIEFALSPPARRPEQQVPGPGTPTFTEALKKQLGLRLIQTTAPVPFAIIDHVEPPSAN